MLDLTFLFVMHKNLKLNYLLKLIFLLNLLSKLIKKINFTKIIESKNYFTEYITIMLFIKNLLLSAG